jgi:hypothetical protein
VHVQQTAQATNKKKKPTKKQKQKNFLLQIFFILRYIFQDSSRDTKKFDFVATLNTV